MNLLDLAEADNAFLLEDTVDGFGRSASFQAPTVGTDPAPDPIVVGVQYIRIGVKMDPTTVLPVAGDTAHITARISSLVTVETGAMVMPTDGWTVTVTDSTGTANTYKIEKGKTMQDRVLGRVTFGPLKAVG